MEIKRLCLALPENIHREIKIRAANKNITMKKYLLNAVAEQIKKDKSYE